MGAYILGSGVRGRPLTRRRQVPPGVVDHESLWGRCTGHLLHRGAKRFDSPRDVRQSWLSASCVSKFILMNGLINVNGRYGQDPYRGSVTRPATFVCVYV